MVREGENVAYARQPNSALLPLVSDDCQGEQKDTSQWQGDNAGGRDTETPFCN